jgi:hypothetical protein
LAKETIHTRGHVGCLKDKQGVVGVILRVDITDATAGFEQGRVYVVDAAAKVPWTHHGD